jgi:hypothetical protein
MGRHRLVDDIICYFMTLWGGESCYSSLNWFPQLFGLSHLLAESLGLVSQAVFKLAPCCRLLRYGFQVNYQ